ncbi:MAG TPA: hypothetical protein VHM64_10730, partial [Candidatus Binatia bacterium]|nr:hypothetical protein [Candidatus Binatia bacterium]
MKKKLVLWMLVTAVWILNSSAAVAQEKATPKFEHVHALVMDAEARSLLLGAHIGLFRSEDGGRRWKKVAVSEKH